MSQITTFLIFLCSLFIVDGANILGIFHYPSNSHYILGSTLLKTLAKKGHQVTMLSPFSSETPTKNYEEIELFGMLELKEENFMKTTMASANLSITEKVPLMASIMKKINDNFFTNPSLKALLTSNRTFDLVILLWFSNDAFLAISHHFGAPTIAFSTTGGSFMSSYITRNPEPYSYVPNIMTSFSDEMNFFQRVTNILYYVGFGAYISIVFEQETIRQKYFPNAPPTHEMVKNISLVLLNSHYSIESPRPYVPTMIQIGGFHIDEPKPLEKDLKLFMDSAKEGVIFFSLGSNLRSSDLPEHKLKSIIKCFSKLHLKILWKFENVDIKNLPPNVKIGKWLPQRDILAHPNTKLFISHGGLLSTTEAVYLGVPIVGIPIFADQEINIADSVRKGYALKVSLHELSEETLTKAIEEILNNPKYKVNIKKRSLILRDQPMRPIDKAIYWVEYVLRHKGAHHLKTSALKLEWYQYYLLDVIAFLSVVLILTFSITYCGICLIVKGVKHLVFKRKIASKPVSQKKKKVKLT